jgi:hypothetical protein
MARVVDRFPEPARRTRYPWAEWADGQIRRLEQGVDFVCAPRAMQSNVLMFARRRDIAVRTQVERDRTAPDQKDRWLYVQFYPDRAYAQRPQGSVESPVR